MHPTQEVKVIGTVGEHKREALAALLQISPALNGEVYGFTQASLKAVCKKFEMGTASSFARSILAGNALFEALMQDLITQGWIRQETNQEGNFVYFPSRHYLKVCNLV